MPNDVDVREMTDKAIVDQVDAGYYACPSDREACDEILRRLSALRSEVERLKAELAKQPWKWEEVAIMRELCEAADSHFGETGVSSMNYDSYLRWFGSLNAYRAMKEEKQAEPLPRLQPKVKLDPDYAKRLNDAD